MGSAACSAASPPVPAARPATHNAFVQTKFNGSRPSQVSGSRDQPVNAVEVQGLRTLGSRSSRPPPFTGNDLRRIEMVSPVAI